MTLKNQDKIILGIDPGTLVLGYGIIKISGKSIQVLELGVLQLSKRALHAERLKLIYEKIDVLMTMHQVTDVAIEAPFYGKNAQSMLKLGRAQGVAIAAAMKHGIGPIEYAPRKVKQSITGKGNASKEQVVEMLVKQLTFTPHPKFLDASDALGVALCHYFELRSPISMLPTELPNGSEKEKLSISKRSGSGRQNWSEWLLQNQDKIKKS
jgi:crossover junction endodeoxyribonuclease RuvC